MSIHPDITGTEVHTPFAWTYATESARTGATGLVSTDEYKVALQTSDYSAWILTSSDGPTWYEIGVPQGGIILWSGAVANIPSGWYICDGTNSTPNLTDRFVIGAGTSYSVDATGDGSIPSHTHGDGSLATASAGSHTHSLGTVYIYENSDYSGSGVRTTNMGKTSSSKSTQSSGSHTHTISGSTGSYGSGSEVIAKYYALAYIMKG